MALNWVVARNSSNVHRFAWDNGTLVVEFLNGSVYRYMGVPVEKFSEFCCSPSKGQYFARSIRGQYGFEQLVSQVR